MLNPFNRTREPVMTELVVAGPAIASLRIRDLLDDPQLRVAMAVKSVAAMDTEQTAVWSRPARPRPRPYDREVDGLNALDGSMNFPEPQSTGRPALSGGGSGTTSTAGAGRIRPPDRVIERPDLDQHPVVTRQYGQHTLVTTDEKDHRGRQHSSQPTAPAAPAGRGASADTGVGRGPGC